MTDQLIQVTPMVQIVTADTERVFAFSEISLEGDDPATISDADLKARVARFMDVDARSFNDLIVTRPGTGNVLLAPKPVYGGNTKAGVLEYLIASLIAILIIVGATVIMPLFGYMTGWVLSHIFVFAGKWIVGGANQVGINITLESLPVVTAFLFFIVSALPTVKHKKD